MLSALSAGVLNSLAIYEALKHSGSLLSDGALVSFGSLLTVLSPCSADTEFEVLSYVSAGVFRRANNFGALICDGWRAFGPHLFRCSLLSRLTLIYRCSLLRRLGLVLVGALYSNGCQDDPIARSDVTVLSHSVARSHLTVLSYSSACAGILVLSHVSARTQMTVLSDMMARSHLPVLSAFSANSYISVLSAVVAGVCRLHATVLTRLRLEFHAGLGALIIFGWCIQAHWFRCSPFSRLALPLSVLSYLSARSPITVLSYRAATSASLAAERSEHGRHA